MIRPPRLPAASRLLAALAVLAVLAAAMARAEPLPREEIARHVVPPFALGEQVNDKGVWELLNSGGAQAGYVFETELAVGPAVLTPAQRLVVYIVIGIVVSLLGVRVTTLLERWTVGQAVERQR